MFSFTIGPGLELRPPEERFVQEMYDVAIANRKHLKPFMAWVEKLTSVEDTRKWVRDCLESQAKKTSFNATIWENGRFVGGLGFHHIHTDRRYGEIGYWLAKEAQGRGIMTCACRALVCFGFDALSLHRAEIRCDPDNVRSRAIPKRLGFREEGVLRESLERWDGVMRDAVVYGLLAHEWKR
jgi:ribosomal-protein-serine acetyltransferase